VKNVEKILVADDSKLTRQILKKLFEQRGYHVIEAEGGRQALDAIAEHNPALVIVDVKMPDIDGLSVLEKMHLRGDVIPTIVISGYGVMDTAIRAIRSGAYDYISKPLDLDKISKLVERCLSESPQKRDTAEADVSKSDLIEKYEMVGTAPAMLEVYKTIGAIASTENTTTALILGESGTGKELVARQIHSYGKRPEAPFVALNMAALPDRLIESELFGYEKGAFTGAEEQRKGKFELAQDGSIFLDEIGDLSLGLQHKLLRVLQEREFARVGGSNIIKVKARIIAATNNDLQRRIEDGLFREDLYYRLNMVTIQLPSLRERKEDIPKLAELFVRQQARQMDRTTPELTSQTINHLNAYDWPGNVRELEYAIARAMVMSRSERILPEDIPLNASECRELDLPILDQNLKKARQKLNDAFELKFLHARLKETNGNITKAASISGINRESFHRLMNKHKLKAEKFK